MVGFFIAIFSGILMSLQGVFNTGVTKETGLWVSNCWVQFTALVVCIVGWAMSGRTSFAELGNVQPRYLLFGGVMGAFITLTVVKSMSSLVPAGAVLFIVVAQIASAYLIELFGLFGMERTPFSVRKMIGIAIAVAGIIVFQKE